MSLMTQGPRQRTQFGRHARSGVTLVLLVVLVIGSGWYGWQALRAPAQKKTTAAVTTNAIDCVKGPAKAYTPGEVSVHVYNSTSTNGLGQSAARQVLAQGFVVVDVNNDPKQANVKGVAEVRAAKNSPTAYLMLAYVPGAVLVDDDRKDATIDLVVGAQFKALTPPPAPPAPPKPCSS